MNLLHRYLFREVFFATVVAVALFAFVMLGGTAIHDIVGYAANGQLTVGQSAEMTGLLAPFVLTYALPFGLLTAVLLVLGRVSAQHEVTAMRSAGLGLMQIGAPVMFIAVLGVCASLAINFIYAPRAKTRYREMLFEAGQQNPVQLIIPGTFVREFPRVVIYVSERDGRDLRSVWVWQLDEAHRVKSFWWAEHGSLRVDDANENLVVTCNGQMLLDVRNEKNPEDFTRMAATPTFNANGREFRLELGDVFKSKIFEKKVSWMDFSELVSEYHRLHGSEDAKDQRRLQEVKMSLHEKGTLAFSVLSFAMIAVPLGIQTRRKETSANLGLALALILAFYFGIIAVGWIERRADLHPELLLWAPNVVFQALAGWMWWRFGRN